MGLVGPERRAEPDDPADPDAGTLFARLLREPGLWLVPVLPSGSMRPKLPSTAPKFKSSSSTSSSKEGQGGCGPVVLVERLAGTRVFGCSARVPGHDKKAKSDAAWVVSILLGSMKLS
jgi:hypothetical protein